MNRIIAFLACAMLFIACKKETVSVPGPLTDGQMLYMLQDKKWQQVDERFKDTAGTMFINFWKYSNPDYARDNYFTWYSNKGYVINDYLKKTPGITNPVIDTGSWSLKDGIITQVSNNNFFSYYPLKIDTITLNQLVLKFGFNDTTVWQTFEIIE